MEQRGRFMASKKYWKSLGSSSGSNTGLNSAKSVNTTQFHVVHSTFSGLTSPWTTPKLWHTSNARNSWYSTHSFSTLLRNGRVDKRSNRFAYRYCRIRYTGVPTPGTPRAAAVAVAVAAVDDDDDDAADDDDDADAPLDLVHSWVGSKNGYLDGDKRYHKYVNRDAKPRRSSSGMLM